MAETGFTELFKAWRDIGFYDQDLRKRSGLRTWNRWLRKPGPATP